MSLLVLIPLILFAVLGVLAFQLAWAPPPSRRARRRRVALVVAGAVTPFVLALNGVRLVHRALTTADASEKASLLAAGISEAMNCFAYGVLLSGGLLLAFAVGFVARRWSGRGR